MVGDHSTFAAAEKCRSARCGVHRLQQPSHRRGIAAEAERRREVPGRTAEDVILGDTPLPDQRLATFNQSHIVGLAEDILPSFQSIKAGESSPEMEEERRNCFVAITRAREWLCLSYADTYRGWSKRPSRFLTEMGFTLPDQPTS